jgi:hypothetical protein
MLLYVLMSEAPKSSGNILTRNRGRLTAAAVAVAVIACGPSAYRKIKDWVNPDSTIVAGVPGQVEGHSRERYCASSFRAMCLKYAYNYYLTIEQCPEDVAAANAGRPQQSFHPDIGVFYQHCNYDNVQVDVTTWQQAAPGSTITFAGPVGGLLEK